MLICGDFLTDSYYDLDRQCQEDSGYVGSQACNVSPHYNNTSPLYGSRYFYKATHRTRICVHRLSLECSLQVDISTTFKHMSKQYVMLFFSSPIINRYNT